MVLLLVALPAHARDLQQAKNDTTDATTSAGQDSVTVTGRDLGTMIVGGTLAPEGRYPYMVNIATSAGGIYCGGSLIAANVVMCAAHCAGAGKVHVGRWDLYDASEQFQTFNVASEVKHPDYNDNTMDNDFMLLKLSGSVQNIAPLKIDDGSGMGLNANSDPNKNVNIMGWGTTSSGGNSSPKLLEASVKYIPNNVCNSNYGSGSITSSMMCAASSGKDSCQGDSGGPLILKGSSAAQDVQVGVVSWGYGCANPSYPGVYARISAVRPWIVSVMEGWGVSLPDDGGFPSSPDTSSKCCSEVPFINANSNDVCADSEWPGQSCVSSATYQQAVDMCAAAGARLCTYEEVQAGETAGTGCGHDVRSIWTSSTCSNGNGRYTGYGSNGSNKQCVTSTSVQAAVRCCADKCSTPPPSPGTSSKCCSELPFMNANSNDVCADSEWPGQSCVSSATYQQAVDMCTAAGARLCTYEEVQAGETAGTGCGHDVRSIWTSSPCGSGADALMADRQERLLAGLAAKPHHSHLNIQVSSAAAAADTAVQDSVTVTGRDLGTMIVGGTLAPEGRYPYMVNIATSAGGIYCGGSLIAANVVMCAAHCAGAGKVHVGRWDLYDASEQFQTFNVASEVKHPNYNDNTMDNDFMLLKLSGSVQNIAPLKIDDGSGMGLNANSDPNKNVNIMGWGTTSSGGNSSPKLLEASVKYIPNNVCNSNYGSGSITSSMMCAASSGKDSCQGDSGGPLILKGSSAAQDVQVGVVSWGYGCANPSYPGVYARISAVRPWIVSVMAGWGVSLPGSGGSGYYTGYGSNGSNKQCVTSTTATAAVRCCADKCNSPAPSPSPSPPSFPSSPGTSSKCCSEVPFINANSNDVCADSEWPGQSCVSSATYQQAVDTCTAAGARLCTYGEVQAGETAGTGCGHDLRSVWTSSTCSNGNGRYTGYGWNGSNKQCVTSTSAKAAVRCCADKCDEAVSCGRGNDQLMLDWISSTQVKGSCSSGPARYLICAKDDYLIDQNADGLKWSCKSEPLDKGGFKSSLTCSQIGWGSGLGEASICAASGWAGQTCVNAATYVNAKSKCEAKGARLCTMAEIQNRETSNTGCGHDGRLIWSSTTCTETDGQSGHMAGYGSNGSGASCYLDSQQAALRCCADA